MKGETKSAWLLLQLHYISLRVDARGLLLLSSMFFPFSFADVYEIMQEFRNEINASRFLAIQFLKPLQN